MTHLGMGEKARDVAGITDGLLRLSIGLEAEQDLLDESEGGIESRRYSHQNSEGKAPRADGFLARGASSMTAPPRRL